MDNIKWPMFVFVMSMFIAPILGMYYLIMDGNSNRKQTYIISGIFAILLSIYASNHFRSLFNLKQQIDRHSKLNNRFKTENIALQTEVNKLQIAQHELKETSNKLHSINARVRESNEAFRTTQHNMQTVNANSIQGMQQIFTKMKKLSDCIATSLNNNERKVLVSIFERFAHKDSNNGMSKKEFDEFSEMLPDTYKARFKKLGTFKKLSDNKSYISYQDFECCMDLFVEINIKNVNIIEFRIKSINSTDIYENMDEITGNIPQFIRQDKFESSVYQKQFGVSQTERTDGAGIYDVNEYSNQQMSWIV